MALAHTVASKVESAYRRGDLFEKRRKLMTTWEAYCTKQSAHVVPFARREQISTRLGRRALKSWNSTDLACPPPETLGDGSAEESPNSKSESSAWCQSIEVVIDVLKAEAKIPTAAKESIRAWLTAAIERARREPELRRLVPFDRNSAQEGSGQGKFTPEGTRGTGAPSGRIKSDSTPSTCECSAEPTTTPSANILRVRSLGFLRFQLNGLPIGDPVRVAASRSKEWVFPEENFLPIVMENRSDGICSLRFCHGGLSIGWSSGRVSGQSRP